MTTLSAIACGIAAANNAATSTQRIFVLAPRPRQPVAGRLIEPNVSSPMTGSEQENDFPDGWLCELMLRDGPEANLADLANRGNCRRASNNGLLPLSLEKYLELLDWTGYVRGSEVRFPRRWCAILDRLGIQASKWVDAVDSFHSQCGLVVGSAEGRRR